MIFPNYKQAFDFPQLMQEQISPDLNQQAWLKFPGDPNSDEQNKMFQTNQDHPQSVHQNTKNISIQECYPIIEYLHFSRKASKFIERQVMKFCKPRINQKKNTNFPKFIKDRFFQYVLDDDFILDEKIYPKAKYRKQLNQLKKKIDKKSVGLNEMAIMFCGNTLKQSNTARINRFQLFKCLGTAQFRLSFFSKLGQKRQHFQNCKQKLVCSKIFRLRSRSQLLVKRIQSK